VFIEGKKCPERRGINLKNNKKISKQKSPNRINRFGLFCLALARSIGGQVRNV
jgi:hypothetical protein